MRTTIRMNDELLREAKRHAAATDRSLTSLIEDAVREILIREKQRQTERPELPPLPAFSSGIRPGIDLSRASALLEDEDIATYGSPGR